MESTLFLFGGLSILMWLALIVLRGRFWRADQQLYSDGPEPEHWPGVAVVIATSDDAEAVEETLPGVLGQMYPSPVHVILVDDHSRDGTVKVALLVAERAKAIERLNVLNIRAVPDGWSRRNWALAQAEKFAATLPGVRYLWLTEPWVLHGSQTLHDLVAKAEQDHCCLVSLIPPSAGHTFWARVLSPAFAFFFQAFHPLPWINDPQRGAGAASPGCTLVETDTLMEAGGFTAFKEAPVLESHLAAKLKAMGRTSGSGIWVGLTDSSTSVRYGNDWRAIQDLTFSTAEAQIRQSPLHLVTGILAMAMACLAPPVVLLWALVAGFLLDIDQFLITFAAILAAGGGWTLMAFAAWPTFRGYEQSEWCALMLPSAALVHLMLTLAFLPELFGTLGRTGKNLAAATKHAAIPRPDAVQVAPRLEVPSPAARQSTPGHAFRRRIARS